MTRPLSKIRRRWQWRRVQRVTRNLGLPGFCGYLFDSTFSLPPANITEVFPNGRDPGIGSAATEALIDIEWSHTVAPGAPIIVYVGAQAFALQDAIQQAVTANTCGAISISFEYCDVNPSFFTGTLDPMFVQAAAQGQSVFVASGDTGAAGVAEPAGEIGCGTGTSRNVSEMAADPNVTGVGGTEFIPDYDSNDNDVGSVPETAWNDLTGSLAGAGGGGASAIFSKPAFQSGSTPADGAEMFPTLLMRPVLSTLASTSATRPAIELRP